MENEISLIDLFKILKKYLFVIVSSTLLGAVLAGLFMFLLVDSQYSSRAHLMVSQTNNQEQLQYNEVQTNITLINTYSDIIYTDQTLQTVSNQLDGIYSPGELRDMITVEQQPNSQVFYIQATASYPENAQAIVQTVTDVLIDTMKEIYGKDDMKLNVISPATYNPNKVSPSLPLYIIIGALMGLALSGAYALIKESMDSRVRDDEFVQSLGLTNLGAVFEMSGTELDNSRISTQRRSRSSKSRGI